MNKIENAAQLNTEIARLKALAKVQEQQLRSDVKELKEELKPHNILLKSVSSFTGIKVDKKEYLKEGLAYALSLIAQRYILKTESKIEERAYEFVDSVFEKIKKFMNKHTSHEAKREERNENK
jgi:cell division septum initiation protein DivIVA